MCKASYNNYTQERKSSGPYNSEAQNVKIVLQTCEEIWDFGRKTRCASVMLLPYSKRHDISYFCIRQEM